MALPECLETCWLCDGPMSKSIEHVLPESITYKSSLRVKGFICNGCNNKTGAEWDVALSDACRPRFRADSKYLPNLRRSGPKRTPAEFITDHGEIIAGRLDREGNFREKLAPPKEMDISDDHILVSIQGTSDDDDFQDQLDGVRERFNSVTTETSYHETVHGRASQIIEVSQGKVRKSLVKSYTGLAYSLGIDPNTCDVSVPYLRGETALLLQEPPIFIFCEPDVRYKHIAMVYSMSNLLLGTAHISGYPPELLTGFNLENQFYVESLVPALLSTRYDGPSVMKAYVVDVEHKQDHVIDIRCLLGDGTIRFNPRQPSDD